MIPYSLVLASGSPRRKELLGWLEIPYEVEASQVDEKSDIADPGKRVRDLARRKGKFIYDKLAIRADFGKTYFPVVIGSDTVVSLDRQIYEKPRDLEDAGSMLLKLSGRTHKVLTGVYIGLFDRVTLKYREVVFDCETEVEFATITEDLLRIYLQTGDPLDKAGSYGIQGQALTFIKTLKGSFSNVVGFPLNEFLETLKTFLGHKGDTAGEWRKCFRDSNASAF